MSLSQGLDTTGNAFAGMATATGAGNGTLGAEQKETIKVQMSSVYANMVCFEGGERGERES